MAGGGTVGGASSGTGAASDGAIEIAEDADPMIGKPDDLVEVGDLVHREADVTQWWGVLAHAERLSHETSDVKLGFDRAGQAPARFGPRHEAQGYRDGSWMSIVRG